MSGGSVHPGRQVAARARSTPRRPACIWRAVRASLSPTSTRMQRTDIAPTASRRPALVQGRGHLPAARQVVLRCQQRRHRRLPGPAAEAGLHRRTRRERDLAAAVLSEPAARRRLRHRRLPRRASRIRHAGRRAPLHRGGARARPARHHRAGDQPHHRPAPLVPARPRGAGPARRRATSTSGPTPTRSTPARASSSSTPRSRNWTWDPVAGAYYWHRFYSHQPDLNFDNPRVLEEVLSVMRFWLDLGIDGLRLDAVPYLVEREGTNNENLPETHDILKRIRAELDQHAPGPHAAGRGQPVAGGRPAVFRRRRRMPHGVPLPADAAHVHGDRARGPLPDHRHHAPDAGYPGRTASGRSSCATTTN